MLRSEVVSRVSNQLRTLKKDEYLGRRFILKTAESIALKFITQAISRRSISRDSSLYTEVGCITFEPIDSFTCGVIEFKNCKELSKSTVKFEGLINTRYGSSIKELYSIDRENTFTQSTLYQYRNDSQRSSDYSDIDYYYIIDGYIYVPANIKTLSALILMQDQYDLAALSGSAPCKSAFDFDFICPDSVLEDVISYTIQQISVTKSIPSDEKANLNENEK
jgi:hypothetical protein